MPGWADLFGARDVRMSRAQGMVLVLVALGLGCGGQGGGGGGGGAGGASDTATSSGPLSICGTDSPPIPCETLHDCPPSGIDCVIGVCEDAICVWVNLATVAVLPIDPDSGLPLGKGCRR